MKKLLTFIFICITIQSFAPINKLDLEEITKEIEFSIYKENLIKAIILQESGGKSNAYNKSEDAVGILQLRRIYVDEANRLSHSNFTYEDRWSVDKSIEIFTIIMNHWNPTYDIDTVAMVHNSGGISDYKWNITKSYRKDIRKNFNKLTYGRY